MTLESPCSVDELLDQLELSGGACAVEVNAEVVPKREHGIRVCVKRVRRTRASA
jgi:sulfur carrier protein ThiS